MSAARPPPRWHPDGAYKPISGDDKDGRPVPGNATPRSGRASWSRSRTGRESEWAEDFETFAHLDERSPDEVQAKEGLYAQLRSRGTVWWDYRTACDLWTYAFFAPLQASGTDGLDLIPTTRDVRDALAGSTKPARLIGTATDAAQKQRFFHWPLEFPDVRAWRFDVVLGTRVGPLPLAGARFLPGGPRMCCRSRRPRRKRMIAALPETDPVCTASTDGVTSGRDNRSSRGVGR